MLDVLFVLLVVLLSVLLVSVFPLMEPMLELLCESGLWVLVCGLLAGLC